MMVRTCNSRTQKIKTGKTKVQSFTQVHSKFKVNLEYLSSGRKGRMKRGREGGREEEQRDTQEHPCGGAGRDE